MIHILSPELEDILRVHSVNLREPLLIAKEYNQSGEAIELLRRANKWLESTIGNKVMLYSAMIVLTEEGDLYDTVVMARTKRIIDVGLGCDIGLWIETVGEYETSLAPYDYGKIQTIATAFDEIVIPLGNNLVGAAEVPIFGEHRRGQAS